MPVHRRRLRSLDTLSSRISYPLSLRLLRSLALDLLLLAFLPSGLAHLLPRRVPYSFSTRLLDHAPPSSLLLTLLLFQLPRLLPGFFVAPSGFIIEPADFLSALGISAGRFTAVAAPVVSDFELTFVPFIRDRLNSKPPSYILSKLRLSRHVAHKHRSLVELLRDPGRQINLAATPCRINDRVS
jgi:hypothetical protein